MSFSCELKRELQCELKREGLRKRDQREPVGLYEDVVELCVLFMWSELKGGAKEWPKRELESTSHVSAAVAAASDFLCIYTWRVAHPQTYIGAPTRGAGVDMPFLYSAPVAPLKAQPQAYATTVAATAAAMALITGLFVVYTRQSKAPSIETQVPSRSMEALSTAMTHLKAAI